MKKVLIVGLLGVSNSLTSNGWAQATEGNADAAVADGGASSGDGSEAGNFASGDNADAGVGDAGGDEAGDAGADTSGAAEQTSAAKPPPRVREYDLVKNEGRACSVSTVGDPRSRRGVGAAWFTGLLIVVGLRRRAARNAA